MTGVALGLFGMPFVNLEWKAVVIVLTRVAEAAGLGWPGHGWRIANGPRIVALMAVVAPLPLVGDMLIVHFSCGTVLAATVTVIALTVPLTIQ